MIAYGRLLRLLLESERSGIKPNIASWIPWLAVDISIFTASAYAGAMREAIIFGLYSLGCFVVISFLFNKGEIKLSVVDKVSLVVSLTAFIAWIATEDPEVAVYFNVAVAVFASIPTLVQAMRRPELEDGRVWFYFSFGGLANLLAVEVPDMLHMLPAFMVFVLQSAFFGFSTFGRLEKGLSF